MAVDIKTLGIGSHILVDGKRERVRGIDEDNGLIVRFPAEYVNANEVEPISIMPDLLKELGFEYDVYNSSTIRQKYKGAVGDKSIEVAEIGDLLWRVSVFGRPIGFGDMKCSYLHELEMFVYIATSKELIQG